jgi:hypothetical protein
LIQLIDLATIIGLCEYVPTFSAGIKELWENVEENLPTVKNRQNLIDQIWPSFIRLQSNAFLLPKAPKHRNPRNYAIRSMFGKRETFFSADLHPIL